VVWQGTWWALVLGLFYNYIGRSNAPPLDLDVVFFLGLALLFVVLTEGIAWILEGFANG